MRLQSRIVDLSASEEPASLAWPLAAFLPLWAGRTGETRKPVLGHPRGLGLWGFAGTVTVTRTPVSGSRMVMAAAQISRGSMRRLNG